MATYWPLGKKHKHEQSNQQYMLLVALFVFVANGIFAFTMHQIYRLAISDLRLLIFWIIVFRAFFVF